MGTCAIVRAPEDGAVVDVSGHAYRLTTDATIATARAAVLAGKRFAEEFEGDRKGTEQAKMNVQAASSTGRVPRDVVVGSDDA